MVTGRRRRSGLESLGTMSSDRLRQMQGVLLSTGEGQHPCESGQPPTGNRAIVNPLFTVIAVPRTVREAISGEGLSPGAT